MNKLLIAIVGAIVLAVVVVGGISLSRDIPITQIGVGGTSNFDSLSLGETLSVTGATTLTGTTTRNNLSEVIYAGSFADATTTLFAIRNPFAATSTVTFVNIRGTNGTTTVAFYVGTSTAAGAPALGTHPSPTLISSGNVSTSSSYYITAGVKSGSLGYPGAGANSQIKIVISPEDYLLFVATSTSGASDTFNSGIIGTGNTFSGTYQVEFTR